MQSSSAPLISVLLPAYNAASTLGACLRSIERQVLRRWECVIVDDGSSDGTRQCARGFSRRDDRFRVLATEHRGLVPALNSGLQQCRGRFVARMDADDLMHRERLQEQAAALDSDPTLAALGCHVRLFPRRGLGPGYRAYEAWLNGIASPQAVRREAFVECPVAHPTLMFQREIVSSLGYRDLGWPEDYDLILRLLDAGERIGVLPRRLLCWRNGDRRLSRTADSYRVARFTDCKAAFLASSFLAGSQRYILWGYGATGRSLAQSLAALGKRPSQIIELHPGRLGNSIHGAAVVDPARLPALPRRPLLVSVAGQGPRDEIRRALTAMGYAEQRDFICAA